MIWDGSVRLHGARILEADGHAFDSPDEGLVHWSPTEARWRSVTAGDWDGITLQLDDDDTTAGRSSDARLEFTTGPMTFTVPLAHLDERALVVEADDPARTVRIQRLPTGLPAASCSGTYVDPDPRPGCAAYWLRVLQHDGGQAWSSPVFATSAET